MPRRPYPRAYKQATAQQLRSFWEAARLGSLSTAAIRLGLTPSTVWKQVRALEREYGEPLLEPRGRGCRLTEAGRILAEFVGPLVDDLVTLRRRYREFRHTAPEELVIATTPRIFAEDLPACLTAFRRTHPAVALTMREMWKSEVHAQVEGGFADIGVVMNRSLDLTTPWKPSPWLNCAPLYDLDVVLVTPHDHPLAKKRTVTAADLIGHTLVNAANSFPGLTAMAALERAGVLADRDQSAEAFFTAGMRRYVSLGFGIALVERLPTRGPDPAVAERTLGPEFGRPQVYLLTQKGVRLTAAAAAFERIVRECIPPRT